MSSKAIPSKGMTSNAKISGTPGSAEPERGSGDSRGSDSRGNDSRGKRRRRKNRALKNGVSAKPAASGATSSNGRPNDTTRGDTVGASLAMRAKRLEKELVELYCDFLRQKQSAGAIQNIPHQHAVRLLLQFATSGRTVGDEPSLCEQLQKAVEELARRESRFPRGHVYCHWCRSFVCQHSIPPDPRSVFAGYTQTGEPSWSEFGAVLLEKRDPRIDNLYNDQPSPVTLVQDTRELVEKQLPVYGKWSDDYRILSQATFGYLRLPSLTSPNQTSVAAVTLQAIQSGDKLSPPILNVIGVLPDGVLAVEVLEAQPDPRIADALLTTRRKLADLALVRTSKRNRLAVQRAKASSILQRLARNLERIFRQRRRRTRHSQNRHLDRRRPTATAFRDALEAKRDAIYRDVEEQTWVVLGPKNRVHIFNDSAVHVTSVVYQGETIRQRTTRGKWLDPRAADLDSFLAALERHGDNGG